MATDLKAATICGDESLVCSAQVLNNEWNRNQLAVDNSVDTYFGLTKGTAQFASGTYIDVILLLPGMIMNGKLANSKVTAVGTKLKPGATGLVDLLDVSANDEPAIKIGSALSVSTSVASLQWIAWAVAAVILIPEELLRVRQQTSYSLRIFVAHKSNYRGRDAKN